MMYTTENYRVEGREATPAEQIPVEKDAKKRRRRRHSDGGKLFAWIGVGFEFNLICGSGSMKNQKKKRVTK